MFRSPPLALASLSLLLLIAAPALAGPCDVSPSSTWAPSVSFPDDPFAVGGLNGELPKWIKFTILTCDPSTVYFQNSNLYPFHHGFATNRLDPFIGMTVEQYEAVSLFESGQQAILGAVLFPGWEPDAPPPDGFPDEFGIQLVRQDAYTAQEVVDLFSTVRDAVSASPNTEAFYFPTFEQAQTAEDNLAFLEANGVKVSSAARWSLQNPIYSEGWAIGELNFVPGDQIQSAYISGALDADDILLTDGVPAEVPFVSGIISLAPSTPNSHVAILASTFDVPFVHLALEEDATAVQAMVGDRVIVRAYAGADGNNVTVINVEGVLDEPTIDELLALKEPAPINYPPMATLGAYSRPVSSLQPFHIRNFGGKATNYSLLLDAIPANTRVATAFSFDLWNEYMDQTLGSGLTLRQEIDDRLAEHIWPPADPLALTIDLIQIRNLIEHDAVFTPAQEQAVIDTLLDPQYGFDPNQRLRFRSSTNVEDGESFSGAGLYDSKSGCLADNLDGDEIGPSLCDPDETDEKGVFRAIKKVYASFYNENAYLERLRHDVDESQVGMAILCHHSFPDPTELANGVAIYEKQASNVGTLLMVTQDGAVSVANPDVEGATPEEVQFIADYAPWSPPQVLEYSNLVVLGETVMSFPDDYVTYAGLFDSVADAWELATGNFLQYTLDFEYKKITPGDQLIVKQVRQVPEPDDSPSIAPFLVNQPLDYEIFQGEYGDVMANHRAKMLVRLETRNTWLDAQNLNQSMYASVEIDYAPDCERRTVNSNMADLDGHSFLLDGDDTLDSWDVSDVTNPRSYEMLTNNAIFLVPPSRPVVIQAEMGLSWIPGMRVLQTTFAQPVPKYSQSPPTMTTVDSARLVRRQYPHPDDIPQQRTFTNGSVVIDTDFHYVPTPPQVAGYTWSVKRFDETTITGLTTEPMVLHSYFSQSYRPEHHNMFENFVFDPWREPGILPRQLQELADQDIRAIYVFNSNPWETGGPVTTISMIFLSPADMRETCPPPCLSDTDGSGVVDVDDVVKVVLAWGTADINADVTGNGVVDVDDLVEVILDWGPC